MIVAVATTAGCGGGGDKWSESRPAVVPAEGTLTYQGKPVEGATIVLAPDPPGEGKYGASAMTDSSGNFQLSAFPPEPGAVPGNYKVTVAKTETPVPSNDPAAHDLPASATQTKYLIPQKFNSPDTSGLKVEIPAAGKTDIKLGLK
jgi:hypothetical protein